jgi:hypothetical protein
MRIARPAVALFGVALGLLAADPFVGTWKLNTDKTKFKAGRAPQQQTITIEQQGDNYDVTIKGTAASGSAISSRYTVPMNGGKGKVVESQAYDAISTKRIDTNTRENTYFKGGKPLMTARATASRDGRTLTVNLSGIDAQGNPVQGLAVYDRQ